MTLFIALVLAFFMFMIFRIYRDVPSVIIGAGSLFLITTALLVWGVITLSSNDAVPFFSQSLGRAEFFHLMAAWYAGDIVCSVLIIRRYLAYRKINTPVPETKDVPGLRETPRGPARRSG